MLLYACRFCPISMFGYHIYQKSMLLYACQFRPIFMFGCHIQQKSILLYICSSSNFWSLIGMKHLFKKVLFCVKHLLKRFYWRGRVMGQVGRWLSIVCAWVVCKTNSDHHPHHHQHHRQHHHHHPPSTSSSPPSSSWIFHCYKIALLFLRVLSGHTSTLQ